MTAYTFDQIIDYTRTSAATYVANTGFVTQTPASRNLLTYTQEFDNAAWTKTNASAYPFDPATATLGPELISNGDFSGGTTTGWTPSSATISVVGGQAELVSTVNGTFQVNQQIAVTAGRYYMFSATIRRGTCPQPVYIGFNGGAAISTNSTTDVVVTGIIAATTTPQNVQIYTTGASIGQTLYFDNVSVREIVGGLVTAPDGTSTADTFNANGGSAATLSQSLGSSSSGTYTASIYAKAGTKSVLQFSGNSFSWGSDRRANFDLANGVLGTVDAGFTATITAVGNGWYRCTVTGSKAATAGTAIFCAVDSTTAAREATATAGTIFIWGAQGEFASAASTYTRNVGGVYPPRFDYDPVTLAPRGLLIEEQRTNMMLRSEEFDNASFTKVGSTATANTTTSPDGTVDADSLAASGGNTQHYVNQSFSFTSGTTYTLSVFAKKNTLNGVQLTFGSGAFGTLPYANFDLNAGTSFTSNCTATMTNFGNGWYRCTMTAAANGTTSAGGVIALARDTTESRLPTFDSDGNGIFVYGAQLEAGAFATSYIPTVASQVTRTADQAAVTGANFSRWYNGSEGTFVVEADSVVPTSALSANAPFGINAGASTNQLRVFVYNGRWGGSANANGVSQADLLIAGTYTPNVAAKFGFAYKENDFAFSAIGAAALTDTAGTVPSNLNQASLGSGVNSPINGHIRRIRYYPTRLSNTQLQALTA